MALKRVLVGERVQPSGAQIRKKLRQSRTAEGFKMRPGFLYTVVRAISARINQNYDGWPADELKKSYHTFIGKPCFVNHENYDPKLARGVVVAARYVENGNDQYVEVVQEIDAKRFPKLAHEIKTGGLDSVSMGAEAAFTICSFCSHKATDEFDMCDHVKFHKGEKLRRHNRKTGKVEDVLVYEVCRKLSFFELSYVFEPADETAVASRVIAASRKTAVQDCPPNCNQFGDTMAEVKAPQATGDAASSSSTTGGTGAADSSSGSGGGEPQFGDAKDLPSTRALYDDLSKSLPGVEIGTFRVDDYHEHDHGAMDVMTSDEAQAEMVKQKAFDAGAPYVLWHQTQWNSDGTSSAMEDRGSPTQNHMDHVHTAPIASLNFEHRVLVTAGYENGYPQGRCNLLPKTAGEEWQGEAERRTREENDRHPGWTHDEMEEFQREDRKRHPSGIVPYPPGYPPKTAGATDDYLEWQKSVESGEIEPERGPQRALPKKNLQDWAERTRGRMSSFEERVLMAAGYKTAAVVQQDGTSSGGPMFEQDTTGFAPQGQGHVQPPSDAAVADVTAVPTADAIAQSETGTGAFNPAIPGHGTPPVDFENLNMDQPFGEAIQDLRGQAPETGPPISPEARPGAGEFNPNVTLDTSTTTVTSPQQGAEDFAKATAVQNAEDFGVPTPSQAPPMPSPRGLPPETGMTASFEQRVLRLAYGEIEAPPAVDTLREEGSAPEDDNDDYHHYVEPTEKDFASYNDAPAELSDPDLQAAGNIDREQEEGQQQAQGQPGAPVDQGQYMTLKIPMPQQQGPAPQIPQQAFSAVRVPRTTVAYFNHYFGTNVVDPTLENGRGVSRTDRARKGSTMGSTSTLAQRGKVASQGRRYHFADGPNVDTGDQHRNDQGEQEEAFITETPPEEPVKMPDDDTHNIHNTESNLVARVNRGRQQLLRDAQQLAAFQAGKKAGRRRTAGEGETPSLVNPTVADSASEELTGDHFESPDPNDGVVETQPKDASLHAFKVFDNWLAKAASKRARDLSEVSIKRAAVEWGKRTGNDPRVLFPALGIVLRQARKNEAAKAASAKKGRPMRKRAVDLEMAAPDERVDVEAPVANTTNADAQASQFDRGDFGDNAGDNLADPDLSTNQNWPPGEGEKKSSRRKATPKAGGILAVRCAEAYINAGLEPNTAERKYQLAGLFENMNRGAVQRDIALLERVAAQQSQQRQKVAAGKTRGAAPIPPGLTQGGTQRSASTRRLSANDPSNDALLFG